MIYLSSVYIVLTLTLFKGHHAIIPPCLQGKEKHSAVQVNERVIFVVIVPGSRDYLDLIFLSPIVAASPCQGSGLRAGMSD